MPTTAWRGGSSGGTGSAYVAWPGHYVYDTISYPTGNLNLTGSRPVSIDAVVPDPGNSGYSAVTVSSDGYVRSYTAGSGTQYFKRNQGAGGVVTSSKDGYTWSGALTGYFNWSTVASLPGTLSLARTARNVAVTLNSGSGDNGGAGITGYRVQRAWSANGTSGWSAWEDEQAIGVGGGSAYTYDGLTPGRYYKFRVFANNARGSSQARESSVIFVPAGGKRKVSGAFQNTTIAKRRSGGSWIDLSTAKRKESGVMVDLS